MRGQKFVHVRQHRLDPCRPCLERLVSQQGVQPDQPAARLAQPLHLHGKLRARIAIQAVADEQHDGALPEQPARPPGIEFLQARSYARASRPIFHRTAHPRQRNVRVPVLQMTRDAGEPRSEGERVHPAALVDGRVQEMQEHPRVAAHRSGYVAQRHKRRGALDGRPAPERYGRSTRAQARAQARPRIDARAARVGRVAPGPDLRQPQREPGKRRSRRRHFLVAHALEIHGLQRFPSREGETRIEANPLQRRGTGAFVLPEERLCQPPGDLRLTNPRRQPPPDLRQRRHPDGKFRVPPEHVKCLVEQG